MSSPVMLKGLFDRPITPRAQIGDPGAPIDPFVPNPFTGGCDPGYQMDINGFCVPYTSTTGGDGQGGIGIIGAPTVIYSTPPTTDTYSNPGGDITINNAVNISDQGIQQVATAVQGAIQAASDNAGKVADAAAKTISGAVQESTDQIKSGIAAAQSNLSTEVDVTTAALAAAIAGSVATSTASVNNLVGKVRDVTATTLSGISDAIHSVTSEIQDINDTLIKPIADLYNSTIGTIANLTKAIEDDLHQGIGGLLQIPGQLADQLGSFDAVLSRTVQQLGTTNKQTVTDSIDYLGEKFPAPFSAALSQSLTGKSLTNSLSTTYADKVSLSSESLSQVSAQAISGLGTLLKELLSVIGSTFKGSLDDMHANWASVESMFVGLLDGALSLLTTLTAIGALAGPLISAAEQDALSLTPVTKLDPATTIAALRRGFIDTTTALSELRTKGFDATRSQVLLDMSVFLADAGQALDWWYRGIIADEDLIANLTAHGLQTEDITALKAGSIKLPALTDLLRWMNFGIITQEQFTENARAIRYDDAQISAILATYQDRETPQTLSQLYGLLENSNSGFISSTLSQQVPDTVMQAGARAGYHPDLIRYIWLNHWTLPPVEQFVQSYFRGTRTLTELQQRMSMANIPRELWDDLLINARPLIPFRSIPSYVKAGYMSMSRGQQELAAHGFDLEHQQIIMASLTPKADTTNTTAAQAIHTLSQSNARTLWSEGAITDDQYTQVLIAHGYTADTAALQLKADIVTEHIKAQKQLVTDATNAVLSGTQTLDDAIVGLNTAGLTQSQINKFVASIMKQQKVNTKIPSIPELTKFLKAQLITLDQYSQALQQLGWTDPWLSAYLGLVSANGVVAGQGDEEAS